MRALVGGLGLVASVLTLAYWMAVAPAHEVTIVVLMFVLIGLGLVGSLLATAGSIWGVPLMAVGAIPGISAYLVPGLMLLAGSMIATRPDPRSTT